MLLYGDFVTSTGEGFSDTIRPKDRERMPGNGWVSFSEHCQETVVSNSQSSISKLLQL